jgi:hypothetical protein
METTMNRILEVTDEDETLIPMFIELVTTPQTV